MAKQSKILLGGEISTSIKVIDVKRNPYIRFKPELANNDADRTMIGLRLTNASTNNIIGWANPIVTNEELVFDLSQIYDEPSFDEAGEKAIPLISGFYLMEIGEIEITGEPESETYNLVGSILKDTIQIIDNSEVQNILPENAIQDVAKAINDKDSMDITISGTSRTRSDMLPLFIGIVESTKRISFNRYKTFVDLVLCNKSQQNEDFTNEVELYNEISTRRFLPFNDTDSYRYLKAATEAFLMANLGIKNDTFSDEDMFIRAFDKKNMHYRPNEPSINALWKAYLSPNFKNPKDQSDILVLPYLYMVRNKFREMGVRTNIDRTLQANIDITKYEKHFKESLNNVVLTSGNEIIGHAEYRIPTSVQNSTIEQDCINVIQERMTQPLFLELIWSYWHEESMMVQAMNAISLRFQNMRSNSKRDPLAEMEISHLLPLNNILWGYIQDSQHRLSVLRRDCEYAHHYGFSLQGKSLPALNYADSRTRFIEAFHNLLNLAAKYYVDASNKLVEPDAYQIYNALREIHFIIAEGMHNQYGDLPTTARIEMLMQQWMLARPELREFLPGRSGVPYTEAWMDRVASMNKLQSWTDTSPMHFNNLAVFGEQILLSIRFGDWSSQHRTQDDAAQWVLFFREQIQGYIHSYKAATGVDLSATIVGNKVDALPPSQHLSRRLLQQNGNMAQQNGKLTQKAQFKSELL